MINVHDMQMSFLLSWAIKLQFSKKEKMETDSVACLQPTWCEPLLF